MPVSTEVLNEDIRELKAEVHQLGIGLAELRTEVRSAVALGKWAGTVLMATLLTSGVGAIIWGASLTTKVAGMEARGNEKFAEVGTRIEGMERRVNEKFAEVGARIDKLESKVDARFDKLEASIARLIEQTRPATTKPGS